jgi:hypothetical protein
MYKVTYYCRSSGECDSTFDTVKDALEFINDCADGWDEYALWVEIPLESVIRVKEST